MESTAKIVIFSRMRKEKCFYTRYVMGEPRVLLVRDKLFLARDPGCQDGNTLRRKVVKAIPPRQLVL